MKEELMNEAYLASLENEKNNFTEGGPFGAIIVDKDNNIVAIAHNTVIKDCDPSAHAEVNVIRLACKKLNTIDLSEYTLYTSCYPCPMCLSLIIWAKIKKVYYGNTAKDADEIGFKDEIIYKYINNNDYTLLNLEQVCRDITIKAFVKYKENEKKSTY